jgi:uncharacterized protein YciI
VTIILSGAFDHGENGEGLSGLSFVVELHSLDIACAIDHANDYRADSTSPEHRTLDWNRRHCERSEAIQD